MKLTSRFTSRADRPEPFTKRRTGPKGEVFTGSIKAEDGSWTSLCFHPVTGVVDTMRGLHPWPRGQAELQMAEAVLLDVPHRSVRKQAA